MLAWAKLLLVVVLAFSPLIETFDEWEQPWSGDSSGELVFTVISCAIALGYASVRRVIPLLRTLALRALIVGSTSTNLLGMFACQQAGPRIQLTAGFSPPPLRI